MDSDDAKTVLLIDLSSIVHPLFHVSASEPDPNATSIKAVAKVRALATGQPHVAVCCDSGRSFRADLDGTYKANRPEGDAALQHQITLARETLVGDGFPVFAEKGFEADDLIASATKLALDAGMDVTIATADKDLLQLVGEHVAVKSIRDGSVLGPQAVRLKFDVGPEQMRDYLSLVGDVSDNVKGAKNIGAKKAALILQKFGSLDKLYAELEENGALGLSDKGLKPSEVESLREFQGRYPTVRSLIALRDDVPIPFSEIMAERVPKDAATFVMEESMEIKTEAESKEALEAATVTIPGPMQMIGATAEPPPPPAGALAVREEQVIEAVPVGFERELEPRSMRDAQTLATNVFQSRLFGSYGTPAAVLTTLLAGREMGLSAMASLRAFHIVEGRATLAADFIRALVLRSGKAKFFRCTERTAERATFETQRDDDPPISLSYSVEEAKAAGLVKEKGAWVKSPADMCVARASSKLARLVFPDVVHGFYSPEEID